jgi:large subunit ribosomal protein L21
VSDRAALAKASVTAKVLGESAGPKVDIFKYKNKTGYRRRQGHRQKYTRIEITGIKLPAAAKKSAAKKKAEAAVSEEE